MFSESIKKAISEKFEGAELGLMKGEIKEKLARCDGDKRAVLEFYYSAMPASDIGDYDFSLYEKFADFGIFLAQNSPWGAVPEEIFFDYVLNYRINNEAIEDCRPVLYSLLSGRIAGKSMKEAALEVNLWCAEHVVYRSTDERTASPLAVLRASYGRCGEESVLAVSALRSVGIPARQVYTPRWAHCDDNHAWVEVWCGGEWHYFGACEPEPMLNRGWFDGAVTRAMLAHAKSFLPQPGEEIVAESGRALLLNELKRYALAKNFSVYVKDPGPVEGVTVRFELLNGSELFPLASVLTDASGRAGLTLGFGTIHIHAAKDGRFVQALADTAQTDSVTLNFSRAVISEPECREDMDFRAPAAGKGAEPLTAEEKKERARVKNGAKLKRKKMLRDFILKTRRKT